MGQNVSVLPPRGTAAAHHPLDDGRTVALIQRMYAPDATPDEFNVFIGLCRAVNLDPRKKQIYHLVYNKDKPDKRRVVIITAIDGYRSIAFRTGDYIPGAKAPAYEYDPKLTGATNPLGLVKATVTVRKFFHGQILDYEAEAYWDEYAPITDEWAWNDEKGKRLPTGKKALDPASMWAKMPRNQLAKVAEAKALRMGWPEELSGLYAEEEMDRTRAGILASDLAEQAMVEERLAKIGGPGIYIQWIDNGPIEHVPIGQVADKVMAFIEENESAEEYSLIAAWRIRNQASMKEFWAHNKGDALAIRKRLDEVEAKMAEVEA